jgi:hypothetical protein
MLLGATAMAGHIRIIVLVLASLASNAAHGGFLDSMGAAQRGVEEGARQYQEFLDGAERANRMVSVPQDPRLSGLGELSLVTQQLIIGAISAVIERPGTRVVEGWHNPERGSRGTVQVGEVFTGVSGALCRSMQIQIFAKDLTYKLKNATACKGPGGWAW